MGSRNRASGLSLSRARKAAAHRAVSDMFRSAGSPGFTGGFSDA